MVFGLGGGSKYEALKPNGGMVEIDLPSSIDVDSINVKQRWSKMEAMFSCWESRNKYDVYSGRSRIFYAEEKTGCCMRQFQNGACSDCAPFTVDVTADNWISDQVAFKYKKDCGLVCCCLCRPVVDVTDAHGNKIGTITDPCAICPTNMTFDIKDHNGDLLISAESGVCQWGLCCPFPLGPCKSVEFPLKDKDGNRVGTMTKNMKGFLKTMCCSWCFEDVESYKVEFSKVQDVRVKSLIMALAIFTDFRYFSNTGDDHDGEEKGQ